MKKIATGILIFSSLLYSAQAQEKANAGTRKGNPAYKSTLDKLNLNASQKEQVQAINEEFREKMQAIIRNEALSAEQRRTQRETLTEEKNKKILNILTPAQQKIFLDDERNSSRNGGWDRSGGDNQRLEELKVSLELTDEQVQKIKASNQGYQQKQRAIYDNTALSADDKEKQLEALRNERNLAIKTHLNPSQATKFDALNGKGEWKEKTKINGVKQKIKIKGKD